MTPLALLIALTLLTTTFIHADTSDVEQVTIACSTTTSKGDTVILDTVEIEGVVFDACETLYISELSEVEYNTIVYALKEYPEAFESVDGIIFE